MPRSADVTLSCYCWRSNITPSVALDNDLLRLWQGYNRRVRTLTIVLFSIAAAAANFPDPKEADFTIRDFRFNTGETLPELRLHYTILGSLDGDNAVLILHGTGGTGKQFLSEQFGGALFG